MSLKGVEDLRHEWDKVRQSLRDTDENIRKLTGRESLENRLAKSSHYFKSIVYYEDWNLRASSTRQTNSREVSPTFVCLITI